MKRKTYQRGFTLIEMIVAIFIFSIVMLIAVGGLLSVLEANRRAQSMKSVMNNLNFAFESMTRAIRVGTTYHCDDIGDFDESRDCQSIGSDYFVFESVNGSSTDPTDQIHYDLDNGVITRSLDNGTTFLGLTSPDVTVEELRFYVDGSTDGDDEQPRVFVTARGVAGPNPDVQVTFSLQTLITQRLLDL